MTEGRAQGVVTGRVTGIDTQKLPGWVTVDYPRETGEPAAPARIATAMAGDQRGSWLMPEVGDEVLIAFGNGHGAEPYVVGFLWNGGVSVPERDPGKRVFRSKKGHTLTFDDTDGDRLELRSSSGHTITLDANGIELAVGGRRVTITASTVEFT